MANPYIPGESTGLNNPTHWESVTPHDDNALEKGVGIAIRNNHHDEILVSVEQIEGTIEIFRLVPSSWVPTSVHRVRATGTEVPAGAPVTPVPAGSIQVGFDR